jgi:hypothetical protein
MVELIFKARLKHFVSLAMLRSIAAAAAVEELAQPNTCTYDPQNQLSYLTADDLAALKAMPLLNRGRLSVQPVNEGAWTAISKLAEKGGWTDRAKVKPAKLPARSGKSTGHTKLAKTVKRKASDSQISVPADGVTDDKPRDDLPSNAPRRSKRLKK